MLYHNRDSFSSTVWLNDGCQILTFWRDLVVAASFILTRFLSENDDDDDDDDDDRSSGAVGLQLISW